MIDDSNLRIQSIDDVSDPRLDLYRQLKIIRKELARSYFICEGLLLLERLIGSKFRIHSVVTIDRHKEKVITMLKNQFGVEIYVIPNGMIDQLVGFNFHRGILACGYRPEKICFDPFVSQPREAITMIGLPQVQDPGNLGSILRLAAGFGAAGIVAGDGCPDPFSRRVLRVSMGGAFRVPVWEIKGFAAWMTSAQKDHQLTAVAAVLDSDAVPLHRFHWPRRTLLVLGKEDTGLPEEIISACSAQVTIPMQPGTDSLNVAVAAGIMLHSISTREG